MKRKSHEREGANDFFGGGGMKKCSLTDPSEEETTCLKVLLYLTLVTGSEWDVAISNSDTRHGLKQR